VAPLDVPHPGRQRDVRPARPLVDCVERRPQRVGRCRFVERQRMRQDHAVDRAMRQPLARRHDMADGVMQAAARHRQGQPGQMRRLQDRAARVASGEAVAVEGAVEQPDRLHGDAIGHGRSSPRIQGLQRVGDAVHGAVAQQRDGLARAQARIDQQGRRGHPAVPEHQLVAVLPAHAERRRGFRARGGRGDADDRQLRSDTARNAHRGGRFEGGDVVGQPAAFGQQQRQGLGAVGHAAAADGDQAVRAECPHFFGHCFHKIDTGVPRNRRKPQVIESAPTGGQGLESGGSRHRLLCQNRRPETA